VLDDEMLGAVQRTIRGIEVTEETLGFEAICRSVQGEGHFLGAAETMSSMSRDYVYPRLADRAPPSAWEEAGRPDAWDRARARAEELLSAPDPGHLTGEADRAIRSRYRILME
ncbi:MAG: trimethylamine methyltransferase family protein, partial [Pseudomonadota bacterium]